MKAPKQGHTDASKWEAYYQSRWKRLDPMEQRLAREHVSLISLTERDVNLRFEILSRRNVLPREFRVFFSRCESIIGVRKDQRPVFGDEHVLEVLIPTRFPVEAPLCYVRSPIWHPNIQCQPGPFQGRICGNNDRFGSLFSLDQLILRVRSILSYKVYHAEHSYPYPEDPMVAKWVRLYGEPAGIVAKGKGILPRESWKLNQGTKAPVKKRIGQIIVHKKA